MVKIISLKQSNGKSMKPWIKATTEGRLYVDTKHPEWQKWFISEIKRIQKYNFVKKLIEK